MSWRTRFRGTSSVCHDLRTTSSAPSLIFGQVQCGEEIEEGGEECGLWGNTLCFLDLSSLFHAAGFETTQSMKTQIMRIDESQRVLSRGRMRAIRKENSYVGGSTNGSLRSSTKRASSTKPHSSTKNKIPNLQVSNKKRKKVLAALNAGYLKGTNFCEWHFRHPVRWKKAISSFGLIVLAKCRKIA